MRSIYTKILIWFVATLGLAWAGFVVTNYYLSSPGRDDFVARLMGFQLEEAQREYELGGAPQLADFLAKLDVYFRNEHHLVDAAGRDLVSGQDRSAEVAAAREARRRLINWSSEFRIVRTSQDGKYRLLARVRPRITFTSSLPYYLWILATVALLCYLLAFRLVTPLRRLHHTVEQFGRGDLSSRLRWTRKDEFGELGRAFDQMAERIVTLLTAERRLLQDVSHELRSPLARLGFAVELARTNAQREAGWERIQKEVDRLAQLVNELLELTQSEGDPSSRQFQEVRLESLLRETVEDCNVEAGAHGCRVILQPAEAVAVQGDSKLLRRAVENVVRNAVRHAPEGSKIEVQLEPGDHTAAIHVRDYGPGVPDELLGEIFKPFFRVEDDRSRQKGGVGLGLSIALRAVHIHNGRIWAENAHPGLRVVIEIPVVSAPVVPEPLAPVASRQ